MNVTEVKVQKLVKGDAKMKAIVSITLDNEFAIHGVRIIEGEKGLFIAMPSKLTFKGEFKDIVHPLNTETRDMIQNQIISEYNNIKTDIE